MAASICVGKLKENCYLVDDGQDGIVVIDPGDEPERILTALREHPLRMILVTHFHADHTGAVNALLPHSEGGWIVGEREYPFLHEGRPENIGLNGEPPLIETPPARLVKDGDVITIGNLSLRVIETPGHTPGSVCYVDDARHVAYTGDTLFAGGCGRTDLYGGDQQAMNASLVKLSKLPEQTQVLPGHGRTGVIAHELMMNRPMRAALGMKD
jgi:hydroxyacylglutathione hydrolase